MECGSPLVLCRFDRVRANEGALDARVLLASLQDAQSFKWLGDRRSSLRAPTAGYLLSSLRDGSQG
jgi:hypothetical protein